MPFYTPYDIDEYHLRCLKMAVNCCTTVLENGGGPEETRLALSMWYDWFLEKENWVCCVVDYPLLTEEFRRKFEWILQQEGVLPRTDF